MESGLGAEGAGFQVQQQTKRERERETGLLTAYLSVAVAECVAGERELRLDWIGG
jgi:hypothetical protein